MDRKSVLAAQTAKGITLSTVAFSFSSRDTNQFLQNKYRGLLTRSKTLNSGILAFRGDESADGKIFIGFSQSLSKYRIVFNGINVEEQALAFRDGVLLNNEAARHRSDISLSELSGVHTVSPRQEFSSKDDCLSAFEATVSSQRNRIPKINLTAKGSLQIGGTSSDRSVEIVPRVFEATPENVSEIKTLFSFRNKEADRVYEMILESPTTSLKTIAAKTMLKSISMATITPILEFIRFDLSRSYPTDTLQQPSSVRSSRTLSPTGVNTLRSLKAVENKLSATPTNHESFDIFLNWLASLPEKLSTESSFVDRLTGVFSNNSEERGATQDTSGQTPDTSGQTPDTSGQTPGNSGQNTGRRRS